jgi:hypothetical protein
MLVFRSVAAELVSFVVRRFSTNSSGVLRAADARLSSAAEPRTANAPASVSPQAARPHRPLRAHVTQVSASPARIDLALRAPRLGNLHQDADRSIPMAGRK